MEKILFINACVRPMSRTMELANTVLSRLGGEVEEVNLQSEMVQPHTWERLKKRDALLSAGDFSDPMFRYARQFKQADTIVIAAPYYDLSFPATLKNYLESICNVGLTFYYDENEIPQSLCQCRRMIYVTTCGAEYLPDFGYQYVRRLFSEFFKVSDSACFFAEKLDLRGADQEQIMADAKEMILRTLGEPEQK